MTFVKLGVWDQESADEFEIVAEILPTPVRSFFSAVNWGNYKHSIALS